MKRVLALSYSQTGQLSRALQSFLDGLDSDHFQVDVAPIRVEPDYPFPWSFGEFLDAFPETVTYTSPEIEPPAYDPDTKYDLVVLAYTVWYLAPSLPIQGFLRSPWARVLRDTPVITLIACRNMWHRASERVKADLEALGARHVDNVVVTDQGPALATFVTTPRWMFTGRKDGFWRVFPPAGVSDDDIAAVRRFGEAVDRQRERVTRDLDSSLLGGLGAVHVDQRFIALEFIGRGLFRVWGPLCRLLGPPGGRLRRLALYVFAANLLLVVLVCAPLSGLFRLLFYPLVKRPLGNYTRRLMAPTGA